MKSISMVWLGQGGFLFESKNQRLLVDPFLSDIVEQRQGFKRLISPPLSIKELNPDYIFITHDHLDHFDPIALPDIHKLYPNTPIIGPESIIKKAKVMGFDSSILMHVKIGESHQFGEFNIKVAPAYHSDPFSVGLLINFNEKQIYLTADTILNETLIHEIKSLSLSEIDVVLVCINGRLGNMNWLEAVSLVQELKPKKAIPMHYGMFAENTEDPKPFVQACKKLGISSFEMKPGIKTAL